MQPRSARGSVNGLFDLGDWKGCCYMDLADGKVYLRIVKEEDIDLLFSWANDPEVRKNAFHTESIPYEAHQKWFAKLLQDNTRLQYIFMVDDEPAGQIRFSLAEDKAVIDYSIAPKMRGRGYGKIMLNLAHEEICKNHPSIRTLIGQVKSGNQASEKCFAACGYEESFKQFELKCKE